MSVHALSHFLPIHCEHIEVSNSNSKIEENHEDDGDEENTKDLQCTIVGSIIRCEVTRSDRWRIFLIGMQAH